ncbi:MAG: hypothetical protein AAF478_12690 [Pseudomonadota bacterium]
MKVIPFLAACVVAFPAFAQQAVPPYTESVLPTDTGLYAVAIGPGGPGEEFGSDATNGGFYRIKPDGTREEIELRDGQGLRNPTGMVEKDGQFFLVDGNQIISVGTGGQVNWRKTLDADGVFFYDIEVLGHETLIVSDFGRGKFVSVDMQSGEFKPYLDGIEIKGLARFEIADEHIYAVSWGADDAWDSALYQITDIGGSAAVEKLSDGFGNLESVEVFDGNIVVGGYRGHEKFQNTKIMRVSLDGTVQPIAAGSHTKGVSDIFHDGTSVWLTYFYDAQYEMVPAETFIKAE